MPYRKIAFVNGNYYHVYNRGVDKRVIFDNPKDFGRFINCLHFFNSHNRIWLADTVGRQQVENSHQEKLVDIICYCLMPNHFHFLLKQKVDNGICTFMRKVSTGYSMYFNITRKRTGSLFQGRFKAKIIESDDYLSHLSRYIHLNPVELIEPGWKEQGIKNRKKAFDFINKYPWSSYASYLSGMSSKIVRKNILHEMFSAENHRKFVEEWALKDLNSIITL